MEAIDIKKWEDVPTNFTGKVQYSKVTIWFRNGKKHKTNGPAMIWPNGDTFWYQNGKLHRLNGPAVEHQNGRKEWWENNKKHRLDGPAIEYSYGREIYCILGEELTKQEFEIFQYLWKNTSYEKTEQLMVVLLALAKAK